MIPQTYVRFASPVTLSLRISASPRPRVVPGPDAPPADVHDREFTELPLHLHVDSIGRYLLAYLPPIPKPIVLYGPNYFSAACADSMEDHAERVLQILGDNPSEVLQSMIDGTDGNYFERPNPPPRIPREIANWRAKAVLGMAGLLDNVHTALDNMQEPDRTVAKAAWFSGAPIARKGPTVAALAQILNLSPEQLDDMFIQAESITV